MPVSHSSPEMCAIIMVAKYRPTILHVIQRDIEELLQRPILQCILCENLYRCDIGRGDSLPQWCKKCYEDPVSIAMDGIIFIEKAQCIFE